MSDAALTIRDEDYLPPAAQDRPASAASASLVHYALDRGADLATIEKLMELQHRHDAEMALKAFNAAMAAAKADIPVIVKNRLVDYPSDNGRSRTTYRHEDLGEIARTVDPILARHGLSYRYRTTSEINQPIVVSCIVAHRDGHSETNTLTAGRDGSGKKNEIQQMGSTITYLQRYTLKAALGLASAADDDGRASGGAPDTISEEDEDRLKNLIVEAKADIGKFLEAYKVESLSDLSPKDFGRAIAQLETKKARQAQNEGAQP